MTQNSIHVLLLSRLGRNDGGRETWVYNFLPLLVRKQEDLFVSVFGIREKGGDDANEDLKSELHGDSLARLVAHQFEVKKRWYPVFFQMWRHISTYTKAADFEPPNVVIGMGIFELVMILCSNYSNCVRVVWLRSIFLHEKAYRFPAILSPILSRVEAFLLRKVDLVIANGQDIAAHYRARGLSVTVIENGVDVNRWRRNRPKLESPIHVAFVGRLAEIKGIEEFVAAAKIVKGGQFSDSFVFHVVGVGTFAKSQAFSDATDLLEVHGSVSNSELPELLGKMDVCVALTRAGVGGGGGTSNALLEQMASGRVIVAWDSPIYRQLLDEESAYLVDQGDIGALVAAFYQVLHDQNGARNRASLVMLAASDYSMDTQVERVVSTVLKPFSSGAKDRTS